MSQNEPEQGWSSSPGEATRPEPAPPYSAYGAYSAHDPYGAQAAPHPGATPAGPGAPASTIVLLVISGLLTLTGVGILWAAPAVLAILALVKHPTDPAGARRLARIGWWVAAGIAALAVLLVVGVVVLLLLGTSLFSLTDTGYTPSTVGLGTALQALLPARA